MKPQTRQDTSYVDVCLEQYLLSSVRWSLSQIQEVENLYCFHQSCAEESTWFLRNHPGPMGSGRSHSQQGNAGCLQVALKVLQCFCIEAGAHHGGNL